MKLMSKTLQYPLDEVSVSRRTLLKYALTSAVASSMIGKAMAETSSSAKVSKALSIELVIRAALTDSGNFSNGVGIIGRLKWAGQQVFLFHRLWSKFGIDTGAAEKQKARDTTFPGVVNDVVLNHQVVMNELTLIAAVGNDAAHPCRRKENVFRSVITEK